LCHWDTIPQRSGSSRREASGCVSTTRPLVNGILGRIVGLIGAVAWSVLTFFVVPVLIFEDAKVGDAIKRSSHIFKERWGEQFAGNATIRSGPLPRFCA
jgi:hypothetical protein